jgi:hypothetical protein
MAIHYDFIIISTCSGGRIWDYKLGLSGKRYGLEDWAAVYILEAGRGASRARADFAIDPGGV